MRGKPCKQDDTAMFVRCGTVRTGNEGKIVKIVAPHPAGGYRNHDGSVTPCQMWFIDPPMPGYDGQLYDVAADDFLQPMEKVT